MTLTFTLGHLVALGIGAIVAAVLMAVLSSARLQEARARAKIQELRAECRGLRLLEFQGHQQALKVHHREMLELEHEIQRHLKKRENDARTIANLQKAFNEQLHDEIRTLNQLVSGAGEKLAGLNIELADWAAFGLHLQAWMGDVTFSTAEGADRDETEGNLLAVQLEDLLKGPIPNPTPVMTSIEEIHSDEEAGPEDDTREVPAVAA